MSFFHLFKKTKKPIAISPERATRLSLKIKPAFRRTLDFSISDLKSAIAHTTAPHCSRSQLLYIYEYILQDAQLTAQYHLAQMNVLTTPYALFYNNTTDINSTLTPLILTPWFERIIQYIMEAEFYGYTLLEISPESLNDASDKDIVCFSRQHFNPDSGRILLDGNDNGDYIDVSGREEAFNLVRFGAEGLGLFKTLAFVVLQKYYALNDWLRLNEKYGIPPIHIKTQSTDPKEIDRLESHASAFGQDMYIITQEGDEVAILDTKNNTSYLNFLELIKYCDEQIAKIMNGQTGASDTKAFVGAAEVHERIMKKFTQARMNRIKNHINTTLIPFFVSKKLLPDGNYFSFILPDTEQENTVADSAADIKVR